MTEYDIKLEQLLKMKKNGAIVVDVRNNREYGEGHISGSINIAEYEIKEKFEKMIPNKNSTIILYCLSGNRSMHALKKIKKMGYMHAYNLYGGLESYQINSFFLDLFYLINRIKSNIVMKSNKKKAISYQYSIFYVYIKK